MRNEGEQKRIIIENIRAGKRVQNGKLKVKKMCGEQQKKEEDEDR